MRVLFLYLFFPDMTKSSDMYIDIVKEFAKRGDEVTVVAPSVNGAPTKLSMIDNIEVLRVKTNKLLNVNPIKKAVATMLLPHQFERAINRHLNGRYDLIVTSTPPITFSTLAAKLSKRWGSQVYLILRDIFPQNAMDLQMIPHPLIFKYFRSVEKKLYRISDHIGCMSQGNIDYLKLHNPEVELKKLHLLPNWSPSDPINTSNRDFIRERYAIQDKFVAIFGGNIGKPQRIENLVELAQRVLKYPDVRILFIGEGAEFDNLVSMVSKRNLTNVIIKSSIHRDDFDQLTAACDIGLISLDQRFTIPNIPSKSVTYLNAGIPILASVDINTDYGYLLQEEMKAGLWAPAGNHDELFERFEQLYLNKELRDQLGSNGKNYLLENLTVEDTYNTIQSCFAAVRG